MSMPKRGHCKYFAQGLCYKGEHCAYLHDKRAPSHTLCNFYQKGRCAYGSRCRYEHVKPAVSWHPASTSSTAQSMIKDSVSQDLSSRHNSVEDSPPSVPCRLWHGASSSSAPFPSNVSDPVSSAFVKLNLISESKHNSTLKMPLVSENSDNADIGEYRSGRPMNISLCPLAADGTCSRGENCFDVHGDLCSTCGKYSLHPFIPQEREEHLRACEKNKKHLEALELSQEIECSVCFDRVLSKTAAAERKFGILSECDHSFCITCIRNWRRSSSSGMDSLRACPICRKVSYFVVPSEVWFTTKEEKAQIVDNYKERLKSIDCKHFSFGNGNCPFGSSCFYKHTMKPGSYTWIHNRPPPPLHSRRMTVDSLLDILSIQVVDDEDDVYTHVDLMDPSDYGMDENDPFSMNVLLHQLGFDSSEEDDD